MNAAPIGAALKARLDAMHFNPAMPIAWPNRKYVPDGSRHLVAEIIRAPKDRLTIADHHRTAGSLVVTVVTPVNNGSGEADSLADAVAAHFPTDLRISLTGGGSIRVTAAPSARDGFRDGAYWRTPLTIPFEVLF